MSTIRITIDIFSGRPNPVVQLSGAQAREVLTLLKSASRKAESRLPSLPTLGYRGLLVAQVDARQREPIRTTSADLEDLVSTRAAFLNRLDAGRQFPRFLRREIERFREDCDRWPRHGDRWPVRTRCHCAPLYEPAWWNDAGQKQLHNNCYNYASDYRTDTFRVLPDGGQPGAAAGAMYTQLTCASVRPAAVADGVIAAPSANNRCPHEGHLVALVIAPGFDFHWYRKGRNGYWSHKPGSTPVVNVDNSNQLIPDPRTANRGMYTQFCTFMVVMHGHIKIR
jgi:hypothetical protein